MAEREELNKPAKDMNIQVTKFEPVLTPKSSVPTVKTVKLQKDRKQIQVDRLKSLVS